jgi:2'-5' RNA ligase
MRTFIAIELPAEIKSSLRQLQDKLRLSGADVKWAEPENIHLTLKFLGERDEKRVEKIKEILGEVAKERKVFPLCLKGLGAFPKLEFPRVVWVGTDKGEAEAKAIAAELEEKICRLGIPKEERPFSGHITLGRVRSPKNKEQLIQAIKNSGFDCQEFSVKEITLFKSTLTPKGPIYEPLQKATLQTI